MRFLKTKLMIVLGAKVGCESCVRKLCAEVCAKKKRPDGGYLSSSKKDDLIMSIDESFVWLTEDGLDTTVADSSNTYE